MGKAVEPDFDQIASDVLSTAGTSTLSARVAEQLRQVWNARGAADCARIAAASDEDVLDLAIKNLDR